jgi:hypothetical protein
MEKKMQTSNGEEQKTQLRKKKEEIYTLTPTF